MKKTTRTPRKRKISAEEKVMFVLSPKERITTDGRNFIYETLYVIPTTKKEIWHARKFWTSTHQLYTGLLEMECMNPSVETFVKRTDELMDKIEQFQNISARQIESVKED